MATIPEAFALALQHHSAGRLPMAEQIYRQILHFEPNHAEAIHLLGVIALQVGQYRVAVENIGRAIELNGTESIFHNNLGEAYRSLHQIPQAAACYQRALELNPNYAQAHSNLGITFHDQGQFSEAVACYRRAVELKPDYAEAYNNLSNTLQDQGQLDEAVACCSRALELKPDYAKAHSNLGRALWEQGKLDAAVACFDRALAVQPDLLEVHFNRSFVLLLQGDWQRGWPGYEYRSRINPTTVHHFDQPIWNGEPFVGKTILLHAEQGLGDTIQFVRYAALVKQRGGTVMLECQRPLLSLLTGCAGVDQVIAAGDPLPAFDVHSPLLRLPMIFGTTAENVPAQVPYLFANPASVERWRGRLAGLAGRKIGIAWKGGSAFKRDRTRSIPLSFFAPLARVPGVQWISLQKGAGREQLDDFPERKQVLDVADDLHDFADTAAVMMNLDLVISCDTAVGHLAGALGVPVWVALPFVPDWRWLLDRDDSPWYPTMRLFRQSFTGDWIAPFRKILEELGGNLR